uniref:EGF-like domain-containing protein n=2 Tax=Panagrellus redivivus TaxID=6233 RepID=A0A7E4V6T1_PANRE
MTTTETETTKIEVTPSITDEPGVGVTTQATNTRNNPNNTDVPMIAVTTVATNTDNNAFAYCSGSKTSADYTVSIRPVGYCDVCLPTTTSSTKPMTTTMMPVFNSTTASLNNSTTSFIDDTYTVSESTLSPHCQAATTSPTVTIQFIGNCECSLSTTSTMDSTTPSLNTTESSTSVTTTPLSFSSTVTTSDDRTSTPTKEVPTTPEITTTKTISTTTFQSTTTPKTTTTLTILSTSTKATTLPTTTKAATTTTTTAKPTTTTSSLCVPKRNATGVTLSSVGNCGLASCPNPTTTIKSTTTTTTTKAAATTKTELQTTGKTTATTAKVTATNGKATGTTGKATGFTGNAVTLLPKVTVTTGATSGVTENNIDLSDYCLAGKRNLTTVSITNLSQCNVSTCGVSTTSAPTTTPGFMKTLSTHTSRIATVVSSVTNDNNVTLQSRELTTTNAFYDAGNSTEMTSKPTPNPDIDDSVDNSTDTLMISTRSFNASDADDGNTDPTSPTKDTSADNVDLDSNFFYCEGYKASANYSVSIHRTGTCDYSKCAKTTTTSYKTTTANYLTDQTKSSSSNDSESSNILPTDVTLAYNNQSSDGVTSLADSNQSLGGVTSQPSNPNANNGCVFVINTVDSGICNCSNYDFANVTDICNVTVLASNETRCVISNGSTTITSTSTTIMCDPTTWSTTPSSTEVSSNTQADITASTNTQNDTTLKTNTQSDTTATTKTTESSTLALSTVLGTDTLDSTLSFLMSTASADKKTGDDATTAASSAASNLDLTSKASHLTTTNSDAVSKTTDHASAETAKTNGASSLPTTLNPTKTTVTKVSDRTTILTSLITSTSKSSYDSTTQHIATTFHTNTASSKQESTTTGNVESKETTTVSTNSGKADKMTDTSSVTFKTSEISSVSTQSTSNGGGTEETPRQSTTGAESQVTTTPAASVSTTSDSLNTLATILTSPQSTTLSTAGTTKSSSKKLSSVTPSNDGVDDDGSNGSDDQDDDDDDNRISPTDKPEDNDNTSPMEQTKPKTDANTSPPESTKASTEADTTIPTSQPATTTNPCVGGCLNDGTCVDGTCICVDGYFGKDCGQNLPSKALAITSTVITVAIAASQSAPTKTKYLWPRYSTTVRMPTNPHEFFRLLAAYFLTIALGVNSMLGMPASNDIEHLPKCAMSYLFGTGAFFLSLTAMIFEAGVDALTLSGAKFNAWTRPAERRLRSFPFWPTVTLYVLVGVAPTAGLWLKHWTFCVTTRSCIGSLGYGDFDREVKEASWLQLTVTLFYMGIAAVIGILAIACNSFDICRCRRRTEAWSINPLIYGREVWPLEANAYFWLVAIQPVLFGVCWMSYQLVNDQRTIAAQWINLILTSIYSATSSVQSSLTTSMELSGTVCSGMTMVPEGMLSFMPSMDHVSLKDKKSILKAQMHPEDWEKFEAKELNNGPVAAYPVRYDNIPFGLAQYMCRLWSVNYIRMRESGLTVDASLLKMAQLFLLQIPDLRSINTFDFAHLFCSWTDEVRVKDSDSVSHDILHRSLRIMDRHMDLSVPPPVIIVRECGTETVYRRKVTHLTPMDGEEKVINARKTSKGEPCQPFNL